MNKNIRALSATFVLAGLAITTQAQTLTSNDGLEGPPTQAVPPPGWNNSEDNVSTVDTQPGFFHNFTPASQGQTYISMVTRDMLPPGSVETVWADLTTPLEIDRCYTIRFDLSLTHSFYGTHNWTDYYFDNPCILQVMGFNGFCPAPQDSELLWQSPVLSNYEWQTFEVTLRPTEATFQRIAFRPNFITPGNFKNSAVFLDNLRFPVTSGIFLHEDGMLVLPSWAVNITWYYNGQVVPGEHSTRMPYEGNGNYKASFYDAGGCFTVTEEDFVVDEDVIQLFPVPANQHLTVACFSSLEKNCTLSLYNDLGQLVLQNTYPLSRGLNHKEIDVSRLAPAAYFVSVKRDNQEEQFRKLVVAR